jgi:hypothetical protein
MCTSHLQSALACTKRSQPLLNCQTAAHRSLAHGMQIKEFMTQVVVMDRRKTKGREITGGRRRARAYRTHYRVARRYGSRRPNGRGSTLLDLVQQVQRVVENDADVVRLVRWMVNSGLVVLTGNFAGSRIC